MFGGGSRKRLIRLPGSYDRRNEAFVVTNSWRDDADKETTGESEKPPDEK